MKTQCPECKNEQDVPEQYIGKEITCSKCKTHFVAAKIKPPLVRRRTAILLLACSFFLTLFVTRFYAFNAGWAKGYDDGCYDGHKKGFWDGIANERDFASWRKKLTESTDKPPIALSSEPGQISSLAWKVLESDSDFWTISWQFKFDSHISSSVWPIFYFYDIDGFLLQECSVIGYLVEVTPSQTYSFTGKELISKEIASRIAYCDAIVKKMDF